MDLTVRELFDRYGPALAVVAMLALLVVLMPSNTGDSEQLASGGLPAAGADTGAQVAGETVTASGEAAAPTRASRGRSAAPATGSKGVQVQGGGTGLETAQGVWGPGIFPKPGPETQCREDGRMPGFSFYQPVCVPKFQADNGGTTWKGVSGNQVKVIRYIGNSDPATRATLAALGAADGPEIATRVDQALFHYFNNHVETYGRQVVFEDKNATGDVDDDEAARADAKQIADTGAFAVFVSVATNANETTLAEALAAEGVMCMCTTTLGRSFYKNTSPYVWSSLPLLEEYYTQLAEYIGKRLIGDPANPRPAKYADTSLPPIDNAHRKVGLIYLEGAEDRVDPRAKEGFEHFQRELAKYGASLTTSVAYKFDLSKAGEHAQAMIDEMKAKGVTTVMCMCDPLYPIFITKEATRQSYFPEHLITGTALIDTSFFGRTYDPAQWRNAFGMSPLWVFFTDVSNSSGYRAYYHSRKDQTPGSRCDQGYPCEGVGINVRQAPIQLLMNGIHYAGPILTPENFALGFYRAGRAGGVPKAPLVFFTPESHTAIKDFTEVWWNPAQPGKDETGKDGQGGLMKANAGKRYEPGQWPSSAPSAFDDDPNPVFTSDTPPEIFPHDADGHDHGLPGEGTKCRSCA